MVLASRKFTDTDIREDRELRARAYRYLRSYEGDFEFLRQARESLGDGDGGGDLTVQVVRGVLNCMLADPRECVEPLKTGLVRGGSLKPVQLSRPARVQLKATFKLPWLYSKWPRARYAHLLNLDRTQLWWFPHIEEYRWYPAIWCGSQLSRDQMVNAAAVPPGLRPCTRCISAR